MNKPLSRALFAVSLLALAGCQSMSTCEYVNWKLSGDAGFRAMAQATGYAADAYHTIADTPIDQLDDREPRIVELIVRSRDSYRKARTYRPNEGRQTIEVSGVRLNDINEPRGRRFQVDGSNAYLVVSVERNMVRLLHLETSRGQVVLAFDGAMQPTIEREFLPFLAGDNVKLDLNMLIKLHRDGSTERSTPAGAQPVPMADVSGAKSGARLCPGCSASIASPDVRFCPTCGELQKPLPGERAFCESCGERLADSAKFCPGCGTKR